MSSAVFFMTATLGVHHASLKRRVFFCRPIPTRNSGSCTRQTGPGDREMAWGQAKSVKTPSEALGRGIFTWLTANLMAGASDGSWRQYQEPPTGMAHLGLSALLSTAAWTSSRVSFTTSRNGSCSFARSMASCSRARRRQPWWSNTCARLLTRARVVLIDPRRRRIVLSSSGEFPGTILRRAAPDSRPPPKTASV